MYKHHLSCDVALDLSHQRENHAIHMAAQGYCQTCEVWACDTCCTIYPSTISPVPWIVDRLVCPDCDWQAEGEAIGVLPSREHKLQLAGIEMTTNAMLPATKQDDIISDMQVGDSGWTVPWAMYADKSGSLWLNGSYRVHTRSGGAVQMQVTRTDFDGLWRVDASQCGDYKWTRGNPCYAGDFTPIPVAEVQW